ncbi:MAG: cytochrome c554 family protein, partial [Desulfobacterales bacterium]|nr:cytochrome c554 family protein [Desulfobacterales bacterium]
KKIYNNDLQLEPGQGEDDPGVKYGPFDDSEPDFHEAEFSKFHTESKICGTCHNVKHVVFNTDIETTYTEWEKSPYNSKDIKKRITCQGCHMYQRPGIPATGSTKRPLNPGTATDYSVEREHIFTHYFVGGNKVIPQSINDKTRAEMAEQRLKNAATIKISTKEIQKDIINIKITNTGAGHSIPTGLTDIRQVWLKIVLKDTTGKIIFSSGELDKNNYLEKDAICYKTVFGDGKGKPVANVAKAREIIKDYRIPALKSVTEKIKLPKGNKKGMSLTVELLYRSISHKLIDAVG